MLVHCGRISNNLQPLRLCLSQPIRNCSMKKPILYGDEASPPVRFVMMTASILNVPLEFHMVDLFKSEHKTDFYTKINPLQKVPALKTATGIICDSHAISLYLCGKYNDHFLYPKDVNLKSKVDEMLFFNSGTLFPIDSSIYAAFMSGDWPLDTPLVKRWNSALDHIEETLKQHKWLSGDEMRLCDLCCAATISSVYVLIPPLDRHIKIKDWMNALAMNHNCFEINTQGVKRLKDLIGPMKENLTKDIAR